MPSSTCFSYSADVPLGSRNRNAAQQRLREIRSMPVAPCFSFGYSADVPLGSRNRDAPQPTLRELSEMRGELPFISYPTTYCFSYIGSACFSYTTTCCFRY